MKIVMTIAKNFATYCSVCSCSCVAACTNAISRPTAAATVIGGAESSSTNHSACCVRAMMSLLTIDLVHRQMHAVHLTLESPLARLRERGGGEGASRGANERELGHRSAFTGR